MLDDILNKALDEFAAKPGPDRAVMCKRDRQVAFVVRWLNGLISRKIARITVGELLVLIRQDPDFATHFGHVPELGQRISLAQVMGWQGLRLKGRYLRSLRSRSATETCFDLPKEPIDDAFVEKAKTKKYAALRPQRARSGDRP